MYSLQIIARQCNIDILEPVEQRSGAVASLVRSIGDWSMDTPHTGVMGYDENYDKIPTAALTMEDAMMLGRIQERVKN